MISSIRLLPSTEEDVLFAHRKHNTPTHNGNGTATHENEIFVDAGELVVFEESLSDVHKQDALASTLFAQLAADYKFDRTNDSLEWIKDRDSILGQIGWVLVKESTLEIKLDDYFVISAVILNEVSNQTEIAVVRDLKQTLNVFEEQIHANSSKVFYSKTYGHSGINLAVNVFSEKGKKRGSLNVRTIRLVFSICEPSNPYLFHLFEPSCVGGKVQAHIEQYRLDESIYSTVRDTIVQRLGSKMKQYLIKVLPLF